MNKIILLGLSLLTVNASFAQDDVEKIRNFRFGLKVTPSVTWLKSEDKKIQSNGAVLRYGGGLVVEYRLAKVVSFISGIQIDVDGGKTKYINDGTNKAIYNYDNVDETILKFSLDDTANTNYTRYQLNNRSYNFTYVTLPVGLKLKTKEIGMVTYFGQIGLNTSVRWKTKSNDELTNITNAANDSKEKLIITKDVNLVRMSLNAGLGGEINLSGSTSLLIGLNYCPSFTNVLKKESSYVERKVIEANGTVRYEKYPHIIKSNAVVLTVGILF
jgi:hypothetical protein